MATRRSTRLGGLFAAALLLSACGDPTSEVVGGTTATPADVEIDTTIGSVSPVETAPPGGESDAVLEIPKAAIDALHGSVEGAIPVDSVRSILTTVGSVFEVIGQPPPPGFEKEPVTLYVATGDWALRLSPGGAEAGMEQEAVTTVYVGLNSRGEVLFGGTSGVDLSKALGLKGA